MCLQYLVASLLCLQPGPASYADLLPMLVQRTVDWTQQHEFWDGQGPTAVDVDSYLRSLASIGKVVSDTTTFRAATGFARSVKRDDVMSCAEDLSCHIEGNAIHISIDRLSASPDGRLSVLVNAAVTTRRRGAKPGVCPLLLEVRAEQDTAGNWSTSPAEGFRVC